MDRWFQSQTRSRSTCDAIYSSVHSTLISVSISDEKPLHMRHRDISTRFILFTPVSISDEKPLHMRPAVPRQAHEAVQSPGLRGIRHKSLELGHGECLAAYYT
jgi:hypothetical protein